MTICKWLLRGVLASSVAAWSGVSLGQPAGDAPQYQPPKRGAPASRVGGGTRGIGDESPRVVVLAPDHTGLTLSEQPTLYFYVSRAAKARLEVTVINDQAVQPLVEKDLPSPTGPGVHRLSLKDWNVALRPGVEYRWFVGLVVDAGQRSNDVIASGTIQRVEPSADLVRKLAAAPAAQRYSVLAAEGIWYDAIDEVSRMVDVGAASSEARRHRATLLQQVGLEEIAAYDRSR